MSTKFHTIPRPGAIPFKRSRFRRYTIQTIPLIRFPFKRFDPINIFLIKKSPLIKNKNPLTGDTGIMYRFADHAERTKCGTKGRRMLCNETNGTRHFNAFSAASSGSVSSRHSPGASRSSRRSGPTRIRFSRVTFRPAADANMRFT